ncbi:MAG: PilZ domain-containing protein [Desulfobacterales bacterium]|nr:MAG: PilZ domain-containing protein [Desulfobacterales bacterium]
MPNTDMHSDNLATEWESSMADRVKLKKYNVTIARLLDVILNMSEEQQAAMLKQAEAAVKSDRRVFVRKACHLAVDFAASDRTHKGYIKNISQHGVFISAKAPIVIGEEVLMVFKASKDAKPVKLKGEIAHATRWGIGVEFCAKGPNFDQIIDEVIKQIR